MRRRDLIFAMVKVSATAKVVLPAALLFADSFCGEQDAKQQEDLENCIIRDHDKAAALLKPKMGAIFNRDDTLKAFLSIFPDNDYPLWLVRMAANNQIENTVQEFSRLDKDTGQTSLEPVLKVVEQRGRM